MADGNQPALVLDLDVASSEPVHFAGFPGVWVDGQPIAVSELGFADADEAHAALAAAGVPLTATTVAAGEGLMPVQPNTAPGADEARATGWTPGPGDPGVDLAPGETFPPEPARDVELETVAETILDLNAADAIAAIALIDNTSELEALTATEQARRNPRSTVLQAIADRQAEVARADDEEEAAE